MPRPSAPTPRPVAVNPMACSRCGLWVDGAMKTPAALRFLGLSKPRLYEIGNAGKVAYRYDGRQRLWSKVSLVAYLESLPVESPAAVPVPRRKSCLA